MAERNCEFCGKPVIIRLCRLKRSKHGRICCKDPACVSEYARQIAQQRYGRMQEKYRSVV